MRTPSGSPRASWTCALALLVLALLACGGASLPAATLTPAPARTVEAVAPTTRPATVPPPSATARPSPTPRPPRPTLTPWPAPSPAPAGPFQVVDPGQGLPPGPIGQLWVAPGGRLWVGAAGGLFAHVAHVAHVDDTWVSVYPEPAAVLGADPSGRVWVLPAGEETVAACDLEPGSDTHCAAWTVYGAEQGWTTPPPPDYLSPGYGDLAVDRQGRVWLATGRDDLRVFDPAAGTWSVLHAADLGFAPPEYEGYQGHFLSDVAVDGSGAVWVTDCIGQGEGLAGQGARRFDGQQWHAVPELDGQCVYDVEVDAAGQVWLGGFDALNRFDPAGNTWSHFPLPAWERRQLVHDLALDPAGNPWVEILRFGGASPYGAVARYHLQDGAWLADYDTGSEDFSRLAFAPDGTAWLCAGGTVYHLAGGQVEEAGSVATSLCPIAVDGPGRVWVGTYAGLLWLDP